MFDWSQVFGRRLKKKDGVETKLQDFVDKLRKEKIVKVAGTKSLKGKKVVDFYIGNANKYSVVTINLEGDISSAALRFPSKGIELERYVELLPEDLRRGSVVDRMYWNKQLGDGGEIVIGVRKTTCPHIIVNVNDTLQALNHMKKIVLRVLENSRGKKLLGDI